MPVSHPPRVAARRRRRVGARLPVMAPAATAAAVAAVVVVAAASARARPATGPSRSTPPSSAALRCVAPKTMRASRRWSRRATQSRSGRMPKSLPSSSTATRGGGWGGPRRATAPRRRRRRLRRRRRRQWRGRGGATRGRTRGGGGASAAAPQARSVGIPATLGGGASGGPRHECAVPAPCLAFAAASEE